MILENASQEETVNSATNYRNLSHFKKYCRATGTFYIMILILDLYEGFKDEIDENRDGGLFGSESLTSLRTRFGHALLGSLDSRTNNGCNTL